MSALVLLPVCPASDHGAAADAADRAAEQAQRWIAIASGAVLLDRRDGADRPHVAGEILVLPLGNWHPTVGIVWVIDTLAAIMLLLTAVTSLATLLYAGAGLRDMPRDEVLRAAAPVPAGRREHELRDGRPVQPLRRLRDHAADVSFALIALGARPRQLNQTFPYVLVNLVASALFLGGVGAVYGTAGTVNMAELSRRVAEGGCRRSSGARSRWC
jgi:multicomponent Na+:H+ antiporter subunit D